MNKNKVTVYVGGRRLMLVSSENEEYIKDIARKVNDRIDTVAKAYPQLDARGCAVMTALDYADDERKALGKKAELVEQANKVLKQADKQSKQIIELKNQNAELNKKYDELLEKFEDLKKKNSNLTAQYNELKKFLDKQIGMTSQNKKDDKKTADISKTENAKSENIKTENSQKTNEQKENPQAHPQTKPQINSLNNPQKPPQNNPQNKKQFIFGKDNANKSDKKINENIIKPETAADVMRKGYIPLRQYSLFDEDNK